MISMFDTTNDEFMWWKMCAHTEFIHNALSGRRPLLRFDHPGRKLAEKYFSARVLGERRKS